VERDYPILNSLLNFKADVMGVESQIESIGPFLDCDVTRLMSYRHKVG
jgi:hypothetical protein